MGYPKSGFGMVTYGHMTFSTIPNPELKSPFKVLFIAEMVANKKSGFGNIQNSNQAQIGLSSLLHNIPRCFYLVLVFWNLFWNKSAFSLYFVTSSFLCRKCFVGGV